MRLAFPSDDITITRREDRTGYDCPDGQTYPSVTTILGATSSPESKARLAAWLERPGAAQESAAACRRGTWMHEQIENHLSGLPTSRHLAFNGYFKSVLPWLEANIVETIALEKPIWHPAGFSGTFDCLAFCADWSELTICDWKSSKRTRSADLVDNYLDQLSAYRLGLDHTYHVRPMKGALVIGRPTGNWPDVWIIDSDELDRREAKFLERVAQYQQQQTRVTA